MEATSELRARGGQDGLSIKLEDAVRNALYPRSNGPRRLIEVEETRMEADPYEIIEEVRARVGRWEYDGRIRWHRSAEEGAGREDTFAVFEYTPKDADRPRTTLRFTKVKDEEISGEPSE